ncbi:toxin, partial [Vibrio anguillarum]|nr:toxin [Vibrio anguillarum]
KGRDQFFWAKRKPYIYKHAKNSSTPVIPKGKDSNLIKKKIPLDAFLLYKSTATGIARSSGALNVLAKNPALIAVLLMIIFGIGYLTY